jgi:methylenetetrahydrofolate reductase (NADPH)
VLQKFGVREVSIAGYPEGHPDIPADVLWRHLDEKALTLAQEGLDAVVLTQFAFDTDPVMTWIGQVRDRGIDAQIRIGTPGPAGIKRLLGFARRFGIGANAMIVKKYGFSLTNLMGTAGPDRFVSDLAERLTSAPQQAGASMDTAAVGTGSASAYGDVKLHFYTFGGLLATSQWAREFVAAQAHGARR